MDLSFTSSKVQERMLRVGIEARGKIDPMEIYDIAVRTLKADKTYCTASTSKNLLELFAVQLEKFSGVFYFLLEDQDKVQVLKTYSLAELEGKFEGELHTGSAIPRLRKVNG